MTLAETLTEIGCSIDELDTPALCIDLDVFDSNIAKMAALCRERGKDWRPHSKAHKSPEIAQRLIDAGAIGVTCAKLGEAEVMAEGGIRDLLIANQIVGPAKMRRLVEVRRKADPIVTVDHPDQVRAISQAMQQADLTVRTIIEVDVGLNRAGVQPGEPTMELARFIAQQPSLEFVGIMGYEGHLLTVEDQQEKAQQINAAMAILADTKEALEKAGLACPIVSAGGTGSYAFTSLCPGVTELQAGGLIFMDAFYRHKCHVEEFDFALKIVCTVVSRPTADKIILDAGRKTHHAYNHPSLVIGHEDDILLDRLSAEHGEFKLTPAAPDVKIGDRLELIPGYSDMTNVLHNQFYGIRNGKVETIWPLLGRGRLQ